MLPLRELRIFDFQFSICHSLIPIAGHVSTSSQQQLLLDNTIIAQTKLILIPETEEAHIRTMIGLRRVKHHQRSS